MHADVQKSIMQFKAGIITKIECINSFRDSFEFAYDAADLKATAQQLPQDIFTAIDNEVADAPQSEEGWARFRMMLGFVCLDARATHSQIECSLAEDQAKYYRFVTAWRKAFANGEGELGVGGR